METNAQTTPILERRIVDNGLLLHGSNNLLPPAEIAGRIEPLITDHLEQSAWWPDHELREGWKLGDYSLYAIGFRAAGFKGLYVRFISEPHCEAMLEVSSSQEDPDLKDAAPIPLKESLRSFGFHPGSDCAGFHKPVRVESPEDCRLLAQEIAALVTGCLGYDPSGPLVFKKEFKERAQPARVFHSLRMSDIARLLRSSGFVIWQIDGRPDIGYKIVDRPRFEVRPFAETSPGSGWYRAIRFGCYLNVGSELADRIVQILAAKTVYTAISASNGLLSITHDVMIAGGVTEEHLRLQLRTWRGLLRRGLAESYRKLKHG